jgi:hypothetical protein
MLFSAKTQDVVRFWGSIPLGLVWNGVQSARESYRRVILGGRWFIPGGVWKAATMASSTPTHRIVIVSQSRISRVPRLPNIKSIATRGVNTPRARVRFGF